MRVEDVEEDPNIRRRDKGGDAEDGVLDRCVNACATESTFHRNEKTSKWKGILRNRGV
jgi:hypothetical protein